MESSYPEYRALREQKSSWASAWVLGHGLLVIALIAASCGILGVGLVVLIDPEFGSERAWSTVTTTVGCAVFYSVVGVLLKRYAVKRGKRARA